MKKMQIKCLILCLGVVGFLLGFPYTDMAVADQPTVVISSTVPCPWKTSPIPITITFSESVVGFTIDDITLTPAEK